MRNHVLLVAISALAFTCIPVAEARERATTRDYERLSERRAELIADGATYSSIVALDARIEAARQADGNRVSRLQRLRQSRLDRNLNSLIERRSDLIASGATYTSIAVLDAQIESTRLAGAISTSELRSLEQASRDRRALAGKGQSADVGVRSARTSPPYGHAYGYWANGPGSRLNETSSHSSGSAGDSKSNGKSQSKGKGKGRSK